MSLERLQTIEKDHDPLAVLPVGYIQDNVALHYIPTTLQNKLTPFFYRGFMLILEEMMHMSLSEPTNGLQVIPTLPALTKSMRQLTRLEPTSPPQFPPFTAPWDAPPVSHYLQAGGQVSFALEAVVDRAFRTSPVGPEYRDSTKMQEDEELLAQGMEYLPECVHDLDFALVRRKLGLPADSPGPYWSFSSDEEFEVEVVEEEEVEEDNGGSSKNVDHESVHIAAAEGEFDLPL